MRLPLILGLLLLGAVLAAPGDGRAQDRGAQPQAHPPLGQEGIYDAANPSLQFLQQPDAALKDLPPDRVGNQVDWVKALERGAIAPRKGLSERAIMSVVEMNVVMTRTASMPNVTFPHRQHTEWLGCTNCHPAIFLPKRDGNPINMYSILKGEFCGVCHGKVAFPITDCFRCHNTPSDPRRLMQ